MLKSPPMIHSQSLGRASNKICHKCLLSVEMLDAYTHASPTFPLSTSFNLIQITLSSYRDPVAVTSLAYLLARRIPTPLFPAALGFIQLLSPGAASNTQLAHPDINIEPKFSNVFPLSLCSCNMSMSVFGVKKIKKNSFLSNVFRVVEAPDVMCNNVPLYKRPMA